MTSHRAERISDAIKQNVSLIIKHEMADPRFEDVEVLHVAMSKDLSHAKIYFVAATTEDSKKIESLLNKASGYVRSQLAQSLTLRHTPSLTFTFDKLFQESQKVEDILLRLRSEDDNK